MDSEASFFPLSQMSCGAKASKIINDPIHGHFELDDYCVSIIDTPHFQRLRDLKQLGTLQYVFPGATHNRFAHSLGTSYLAGEMMQSLASKHNSFKCPTDEFCDPHEFPYYSKIVKISGLCHDLGHGPFSHCFDSVILKKKYGHGNDSIPEFRHEVRSCMMLQHLVDTYDIDLNHSDIIKIQELIEPPEYSKRAMDSKYLYQIISNKENSIDVDKFDYLMRDTINLGLKFGFDHTRLMQYSRVVNGELCFHQKEIYNIYDMFNTRFKLHKQVYNHRASKAVEYMLADALILADPVLKITESITDPDEFLRMTDSIVYVVEHTKDHRLKKSQEILARLRQRELYKFVDEALVPPHLPNIKEQEIVNYQDGSTGINLVAEDIIVHNMRANFGMQEKNPIDHVLFFRSWEDVKPIHINKDKVSYVLPEQFEEKTVRLFCRHRDPAIVKAAKIAFRKCMDKYGNRSPIPSPEVPPVQRSHTPVSKLCLNHVQDATTGGSKRPRMVDE